MKYAVIQGIIMTWSVIFLYYLSRSSFFLPLDPHGKVNWYNVSILFILLFLFLQGLVSMIIYLVRKALKKPEQGSRLFSMKWGLGVGTIFIMLVALNITHLLSWQWGIIISAVVILGIILIK